MAKKEYTLLGPDAIHRENRHPTPTVDPEGINVLDLLLVLVGNKKLILGMMFFAGFWAVNQSLGMVNTYRSEATIAPRQGESGFQPFSAFGYFSGMVASRFGLGAGGDLEKMKIVLQSRELTYKIIEKYGLMPILFSDNRTQPKKQSLLSMILGSGDGGEPAERKEPVRPRTIQDGFLRMKQGLKVNADKMERTITIGFEHTDPWTARRMVTHYLVELSETLREDVLEEAKENERFIRRQIEETEDILLKEKLYAMLAKEIEKETFARAQKYYSFTVLDPPIVPDMDKKVGPNRAIYCFLYVMVAMFLGIFIAFVKSFSQRARLLYPDRYRRLVRGLKPWNKTSSG